MTGREQQEPARRGDIQGLRALAVLAVIAFHLELPGAAGGYLGVDVFFVISGYVMGGLLLREQAAGGVSLLGFWERRARRILPAAYLVIAVTLALAWALQPAPTRHETAAFAQAGVAFAANLEA